MTDNFFKIEAGFFKARASLSFVTLLAVFILEDASYPSGRTWANIRCSSGYSSIV